MELIVHILFPCGSQLTNNQFDYNVIIGNYSRILLLIFFIVKLNQRAKDGHSSWFSQITH